MSEARYTIDSIPRDEVEEKLPLYAEVTGTDAKVYQHFIVIRDEVGEIVGYFGLEIATFLGPLYIKPEHRGTDATKLLCLATLRRVPQNGMAIVITPNVHVQKLVEEELGMEPERGKAYQQRVNLSE